MEHFLREQRGRAGGGGKSQRENGQVNGECAKGRERKGWEKEVLHEKREREHKGGRGEKERKGWKGHVNGRFYTGGNLYNN